MAARPLKRKSCQAWLRRENSVAPRQLLQLAHARLAMRSTAHSRLPEVKQNRALCRLYETERLVEFERRRIAFVDNQSHFW